MQQLLNVVVYVGLNFIHVIFFLVLGMVKYNNDILTKHKIARQFKYIMANKLTIYSVVDDTDHTKDAFLKSKLASQTLAGPVILTWMKQAFSKGFLLKIHLLRTYYLGPDWSSWIVLVKSKILITTGMTWLVSSDKWKVPEDSIIFVYLY